MRLKALFILALLVGGGLYTAPVQAQPMADSSRTHRRVTYVNRGSVWGANPAPWSSPNVAVNVTLRVKTVTTYADSNRVVSIVRFNIYTMRIDEGVFMDCNINLFDQAVRDKGNDPDCVREFLEERVGGRCGLMPQEGGHDAVTRVHALGISTKRSQVPNPGGHQ